MKSNRVKRLLAATASSFQQAFQRATTPTIQRIRQRSNVQTVQRASAFAAVMLLLWGGAAAPTGAQPRPAHPPARQVAVVHHGGHARVVYVRCCTRAVRVRAVHASARRSVHPRVRPVYVVVSPVYPVPWPVVVRPVYPVVNAFYSPCPYQGYPGPCWSYSSHGPYPCCTYSYPSYTDVAYQQQRGYSDGFSRGKDDAEDHRVCDPYRHRHLKNSDSVAYSDGFLNGYAAGYGQ